MIIAEAGVNHNGDINLAAELVKVAANAGADFIKFQTFTAKGLATQNVKKAPYQLKLTDKSESQYEMLRKLELSEEMHHHIMGQCELNKMSFLSTGFDISSIKFLQNLGQKVFKVSSGDITNLPLLQYLGEQKNDVILSTGMSTYGDIESAVNVLVSAGTPPEKITLLHCTTEYPAPLIDVNLRAIQTLRTAFGLKVGYSDHTAGIEIALAAVSLGACVIEKHITLNKTLPGPDHIASIEPHELMAMVSGIRNIEIALGDGVKRLMPSEAQNILVARKSIVARCNIKAGDIYSEENLDVKRPGTGISPMQWNQVLGRRANRDYTYDEPIQI